MTSHIKYCWYFCEQIRANFSNHKTDTVTSKEHRAFGWIQTQVRIIILHISLKEILLWYYVIDLTSIWSYPFTKKQKTNVTSHENQNKSHIIFTNGQKKPQD